MTNQEFQMRLRDLQTKQRQEYDQFMMNAKAEHEREMLAIRSGFQNPPLAQYQPPAPQQSIQQQTAQAPVTSVAPMPTGASAPATQSVTPEMSPLLQQMVLFSDMKGLLTQILERLPVPAAPVQEIKEEKKSEVKEIVKPVKSTK